MQEVLLERFLGKKCIEIVWNKDKVKADREVNSTTIRKETHIIQRDKAALIQIRGNK
jgi:hypothetical protein